MAIRRGSRSSLLRTVLIVVALGAAPQLHADEVYRWEENGKTVYSSTPPHQNAKPAELPEIMRGEVKIPKNLLVTCDKHGGVNCEAGPDSDGSVICYDGYRDAAARFRFSCNTPKLEVADIAEPDAEGKLSVFVRNSRSVAARKPSLHWTREGSKVALQGPEEIAGYGVGEFVIDLSADQTRQKPSIGELQLDCENCIA